MHCYYRVYDQWVKGHAITKPDGLSCWLFADSPGMAQELVLRDIMVVFHANYMTVTGYVSTDDINFTQLAVDVSGGWARPRK